MQHLTTKHKKSTGSSTGSNFIPSFGTFGNNVWGHFSLS